MRHPPLFALILFLALGASVVLSGIRMAHQVPTASIAAASAAVRSRFLAGDVIVVTPSYIAGPSSELGELPLIEARSLDLRDVRPYRRVHLIAIAAVGATDAVARALATAGRAVETLRFPQIEVTTYELASFDRVLVDLWRDLERARVTNRRPNDTARDCTFEDDRFVCPGAPEWNYVGREIRQVGNAPWPCVWMHPPDAGGLLRVELPPLAAMAAAGPGELAAAATAAASSSTTAAGAAAESAAATAATTGRRVIVIDARFIDSAAARVRAPVRLRLLAGEVPLWSGAHPPGSGRTYVRQPIGDGAAPLAIEVDSSNNQGAHFCMNVALVEPETARPSARAIP